jgi:hypothetical protein
MVLISIGSVILSLGFLYKVDSPSYSGMKYYQILGRDLGVRVPLWLVGALFIAYAVYGQFM